MTRGSHERGRVEEIELKNTINLNSYQISRALIEIDHINDGLDKLGRLKKMRRTSFTLKDIEKFILMLDQEEIMARKYKGTKSQFEIRIDCPIKEEFFHKEFIMIFDLDHNKPDMIHTIRIYPGW